MLWVVREPTELPGAAVRIAFTADGRISVVPQITDLSGAAVRIASAADYQDECMGFSFSQRVAIRNTGLEGFLADVEGWYMRVWSKRLESDGGK